MVIDKLVAHHWRQKVAPQRESSLVLPTSYREILLLQDWRTTQITVLWAGLHCACAYITVAQKLPFLHLAHNEEIGVHAMHGCLVPLVLCLLPRLHVCT